MSYFTPTDTDTYRCATYESTNIALPTKTRTRNV